MTVLMLKTVKIRSYEMGLYFRDGEFKGLLGAGRHWFFDPLGKVKVEVVSQRSPWLAHEKLDVIVKSGALKDRAVVLDLKDYERALVWVDGRFSHILPPGLYAYWTAFREVAVEVIDARKVRFEHKDLQVIVRSPLADRRAGRLRRGAGPRRRAVRGRPLRRDPAAGQVRLLEEHGQGHARAGGPARDDAGHRRPGDHDRRQGHAASERGGHLPRGRRPQGPERGRRRPAGPVPRGAVGPAGGDRRSRTRPVPGRQGRRGQGAGGASSASGWPRWVWRSSRWASAT